MIVPGVSTSSVLIAPDRADTRRSAGQHYSLLLTVDPILIEAAQRLRYDVFSTEPGFALATDAAAVMASSLRNGSCDASCAC